MRKKVFTLIFATVLTGGKLFAHCQMPCGIYHDEIPYNRINQYVETIYKGISILDDNKFASIKEKNEYVRWIIQKDTSSDEVAAIITKYFLQQKIKPDEPDSVKKLVSAHKLLFGLVEIKQNINIESVKSFSAEWEKFKEMFHRAGYEKEIAKMRRAKELKKFQERQAQASKDHSHSHDDDHDDHDHSHSHDDHDDDHDH